jgi:Tol biopolymer transport system component
MGAGFLLVALLTTPVAGQVTERVSVDSAGAQASFKSRLASISGDGRHVAFSSDAGNLVSGDTNGREDVFVRDRQSGVTERVSLDSAKVEGNHTSFMPSISGDGRFVAFTSFADNLIAGDTNEFEDVFVHDRQTGLTECVSIDPGGAPGSGESGQASLSGDGRYVAFTSYADDLVFGDTSPFMDVFVHDRQSGTTQRVNLDSSGAQANGGGIWPSISRDGRHVTFTSPADNLVAGDTNGADDVFVRDLQSGVTERVSVDSAGVQGNAGSQGSALSADGRWVAFTSLADNLVSGDTNATYDAFVHDRQSGTTERVSLNSRGAQGNGSSSAASLSADGRFVAFESSATNLVSGDTNSAQDIFVHERGCIFASSAVYAGDGFNADTIAPLDAVLGSTWSAPLTIGHPHGTGGPLSLSIRAATINRPSFASPLGGRLTEVLIDGRLLATLSGAHDGVSGNIAPQPIPDDSFLVGLSWAAQYTVVGGGYGDFSQAVFGIVGCP